ncbi:MAG: DNA cytosine methyltransferase [Acidimicrobiia bacterium]
MPAVTSRQPSFIDLFCGAGGLSEGFRQAGWQPVAGIDIDPDAVATYGLNFPEAAGICGDLRKPAVRRRLLKAAGGSTVVVGGPPCQAFSQVRNHSRLIDDPRNALYREFLAVIRKLQPRAFVMENVPGLAQMGVLEQAIADLRCRGAYEVSATLVDAADFGVPQSRKRIVFIGINRDLDEDAPRLAGTGASGLVSLRRGGRKRIRYSPHAAEEARAQQLLDQLLDPWCDAAVTATQAIGDLSALKAGSNRQDQQPVDFFGEPQSAFQKLMREGLNGSISNVGVPRINADTKLRLRGIPAGGNYLDLEETLRGRYLTGQRWGPHNGSQRLSRRHYYAYRRLHPDIWSWTLNTKADSVYHWGAARSLSVREFARLQSFPDRFVFTTDPRKGELPGRISGGAAHSRYRQVGNAVPPLLARAIADLLSPLLGSLT